MSDSTEQEKSPLCECGSGIEYSRCCGVAGRTALTADVYAYVSKNGVTAEDTMTPELQQAIDCVSVTPDLFPARVNLFEDKVWFVKMSAGTYRDSVFLDPARMKGTCLVETNLEWLGEQCEKIQWQPTSYIFHTAFCGSTLMSQALGAMYDCLSLREPELLNSMLIYNRSQVSTEEKSFWFDSLQKLLSRRFLPEQPVVVKANDYANPVMLDLMDWDPDVPVLFMYTPLNEFVASCLKADNRREWIKQRYEVVKPFLSSAFKLEKDSDFDEPDIGEFAGAYWSYNLAMFQKISANPDVTVKSLKFSDMLNRPEDAITLCAKLFGLSKLEGIEIKSIVEELMGVYSKNKKFKYSPEQRQDELNQQIEKSSEEQASAESLARSLLGDNYPTDRLNNNLFDG